MKDLTDKQRGILEFLIHCIREEYYTPTVREIADRFGIKSTNAVRNHLEALERKGHITRRANSSRGIELAAQYFETEDFTAGGHAPGEAGGGGIPIVGRVAAGCPITAVENLDGYLSFDSLFGQDDRLYALRVRGDSMIDAGIWDGDYVIVRQQDNLDDGEIGVAIVDEEATVKRIRRRGKIIELLPANDLYAPIEVDPNNTPFRMGGKVIGIHRVMN